MTSRAFVWGLLGLAVAVSCSGDPPKRTVLSTDAGAGGEAGEGSLGSGGSELTPHAGMPAAVAGSGGEAPLPGAAGGGGEPPVVPGEGGSGGVPSSTMGGAGGEGNAPSGSACGDGMYEAYETGCTSCPAPPDPNYPTTVSCDDYHSASFDSQSKTLYVRLDTEIHEALSGKVSVSWEDDNQMSGSGEYDWTFDPQASTFAIVIPDASATAQSFQLTYFAFTDACGFLFAAQSLPIQWFVETWTCGGPTSSCGSGSYDNGEGCSTCPADPPVDPISLGCGNFLSATYYGYDNSLKLSFSAPFHEPLDGQATIGYQDDSQVSVQNDFSWSYSPGDGSFDFYVDTIPDSAQEFFINDWSFTDVCGYQFEIAAQVRIAYQGDAYDIDCGG